MSSPGSRARLSLTLKLREKIARTAGQYKDLALDPVCYEHVFVRD